MNSIVKIDDYYDEDAFWNCISSYPECPFKREELQFSANPYMNLDAEIKKAHAEHGVDPRGFNTVTHLFEETQKEYNPRGYNYLGLNKNNETIHGYKPGDKKPNRFDPDYYTEDPYDQMGYRLVYDFVPGDIGHDYVNRNGFNAEGKPIRLRSCDPSVTETELTNVSPCGEEMGSRHYYNFYGYDRYGYDPDGFNREGYTHGEDGKKSRYDRFGYDVKNFDRNGIHRFTRTKFNLDGYDREGFNRYGVNRYGFNREGINVITGTKVDKFGYDAHGYNRDQDCHRSMLFGRNGFGTYGYHLRTNDRIDRYGRNDLQIPLVERPLRRGWILW